MQAKMTLKQLTHNVVGNSESLAVLNEHGHIEWRMWGNKMIMSIRFFNGKKAKLFGVMAKQHVNGFKRDTKQDSPHRLVRAIKVNTGIHRGKYAVYLGDRYQQATWSDFYWLIPYSIISMAIIRRW
jgi:hypothetical protein